MYVFGMFPGYGSDGCVQGVRQRYWRLHQEVEEVHGLRMSRKGKAPPGMDKKKKISFQKLIILRVLRPDRMMYALRYEIWGYIFQGKCVWGWLVCVGMEKTQLLRGRQITYKLGDQQEFEINDCGPSKSVLLVKNLWRSSVVRHERAMFVISFRLHIGTLRRVLINKWKYSKLWC